MGILDSQCSAQCENSTMIFMCSTVYIGVKDAINEKRIAKSATKTLMGYMNACKWLWK